MIRVDYEKNSFRIVQSVSSIGVIGNVIPISVVIMGPKTIPRIVVHHMIELHRKRDDAFAPRVVDGPDFSPVIVVFFQTEIPVPLVKDKSTFQRFGKNQFAFNVVALPYFMPERVFSIGVGFNHKHTSTSIGNKSMTSGRNPIAIYVECGV